jgi:hypothetical protein
MVQQPSPPPITPASDLIPKGNANNYFILSWVFTALSFFTLIIPFVSTALSIPALIFAFKAKKIQEARGYVLGSVISISLAGFLLILSIVVSVLMCVFLIPQLLADFS